MKILLQTMPHTGTHTMHYLFNVLGGIEVVWHHWDKPSLDDIDWVKNMDWEDFVFVRTHRESLETLRSYESRSKTTEAGTELYNDCVEVFAKNRRLFPRPIIFELGNRRQMTSAAREVFLRCEVPVPEAAEEYMRLWKRINSQHDEDNRVTRAIKLSISKGRVSAWRMK